MNTNGISDSEMEIMKTLWDEGGGVYLSDLMEKLEAAGKQWKANTVLTFLTRLAEKGVVKIDKRGRLNIYVALVTESEYLDSLNRSFLGKFYGGSAKNLVAALLRQEALSAKDVAELQAFWNKDGDRHE